MKRSQSFWYLAALLALLLAGSSVPSPLYGVYQERWGFSSISLTAVFAVYALALLVALVFAGRLSDHLGRRPVLVAALIVQLAAMAAFLLAEGLAMLYVARILQGVGVGLGTAAISAWLLDLQPPGNQRLGSVVGAIAPLVGLALGALAAGFLVQYGPDPLRLVYWILTGGYVLALLAAFVAEDRVVPDPGWLASLRPEIGVPPAARSLFAALTPSLVATWALGGLYLSLGPALAISQLGSDSHLAGGLVVTALTGAGAVASALAASTAPRRLVARASVVLLVGVAITLIAVAAGSVAGFYVGSVVAGAGFGPSFAGVFRSLAPLAEPDQRSGLVASIYIVSYLAFSLPAIAGGIAAESYGVVDTTYGYGAAVIVLTAITLMALARRREPEAAQAG